MPRATYAKISRSNTYKPTNQGGLTVPKKRKTGNDENNKNESATEQAPTTKRGRARLAVIAGHPTTTFHASTTAPASRFNIQETVAESSTPKTKKK